MFCGRFGLFVDFIQHNTLFHRVRVQRIEPRTVAEFLLVVSAANHLAAFPSYSYFLVLQVLRTLLQEKSIRSI